LEPEEAVVASTINAAHVLGIPRLVGSLEVGKQADVLLLNIRDYRDLFRYAGANLVSKAIKRGRLVYQQGAVEWPDD
jgi:imidazolonepropionase